MRKVKIVCTIGPASSSPDLLEQLIDAGMNVARLNFSHGTHESHGRAVKAIREAAGRRHAAVAIIQDLQGPRIRVGQLPDAGVTLEVGQLVRLLSGQAAFDPRAGLHYSGKSVAPAYTAELPVTYAALAQDVQPGARVLIDDGLIELAVTRIDGSMVECTVVTGGRITSHKGINLPGTKVSAPTLTDKDREDLRFGIAQGVDYVALSFVRGPDDVVAAKKLIAECGGDVPVIVKIERPEAVSCLESLLEQADGIMIARGDLGVELPPESVPIAQKQIIDAANQSGKLVITATQMLDSMIMNPRPTRAEASDVANAIFDGTDAVMLSGETAVGKYPVETVAMMDAIVREAEIHLRQWGHWKGSGSSALRDDAISITRAARELAQDVNVAAITVFTSSGRTARLMSKAFPRVPILGLTPKNRTYNRMALYWGVYPILTNLSNSVDEMLTSIDTTTLSLGSLKPGQQVVVISGYPVGAMRPPNLVMLYTLGQRIQG